MKSYIFSALFVIFVFSSLGVGGCKRPKEEVQQNKDFFSFMQDENHPLRKMGTTESQKLEGSYFLFVGNIQSETKTSVSFAWLNRLTNEYIFTEVPLSDIRLIVDSTHSTPQVKFILKRPNYFSGLESNSGRSPIESFEENSQLFFRYYLKRLQISCREEDWPENIQLPLNKPEK